MKRTEKEQLCSELHDVFMHNHNALVMSFSGLKVNDAAVLRRRLRDAKCSYRVVKNTIAKIASEGTPMANVANLFEGTTAIAYNVDDPVGLAKIMQEFSKENKSLSYKAILVEGQVYPPGQLDAVATMPSKPEIISKLMFLLNYPVTALARVLNAPLTNLGLVLKETKKES